MEKKKIVIPTLTFNGDYFKCPKCGWIYPGPLRVLGNVAHGTPCQQCGNSTLERIQRAHKLRFLKKQSEKLRRPLRQ